MVSFFRRKKDTKTTKKGSSHLACHPQKHNPYAYARPRTRARVRAHAYYSIYLIDNISYRNIII